MFNNAALDVFIGLIFIFLLYSLLATIVMEFIAHYLALRARLLVKAMRRMLEDNPREIFGKKKGWTLLDIFSDFFEAVKRYFYPFKDLPFLARFYSHPTIKYLGESKSSSKPSYMQADNFSQTMVQILRGDDYTADKDQMTAIYNFLFVVAPVITKKYVDQKHWILNLDRLKKVLQSNISPDEIATRLEQQARWILRRPEKQLLLDLAAEIKTLPSKQDVLDRVAQMEPLLNQLKISADTLKHLQNLYNDAQYKFQDFRDNLERWFNETMDRASGWYKRQTQVILLSLGLVVAIIANVDTIQIFRILSRDKKTRDEMVTLAIANEGKYVSAVNVVRKKQADSSKNKIDTAANLTDTITTGSAALDQSYKMLQQDMQTSASILGLGWCNSDSCKVYKRQYDSIREEYRKIRSNRNIPTDTKQHVKQELNSTRKNYLDSRDDWDGWTLIGWLITALAISLGAPFWFDLLNKITKLRSAGVKEDSQPDAQNTSTPIALTVNANNNSNKSEEAVG